MRDRCLALALCGGLMCLPADAAAQDPESLLPPEIVARSATEALYIVLDANIRPGGPIGSDGSTIASILAGQSLTFPLSSSSGSFATRQLSGVFATPVPVASTGSLGSLFVERGLTNGRHNVSVSFSYQYKAWSSLSGYSLKGGGLKSGGVYRFDLPQGPAGTTDERSADVDFRTEVAVVALNYGVSDRFDIGMTLPYVRSIVDGVKRRRRTLPQGASTLLYQQRVRGSSAGIGDVVVRLKGKLVPLTSERAHASRLPLFAAAHLDVRLPTGRTAVLTLDCTLPFCEGTNKLRAPDLGLGSTTTKLSFSGSFVGERFSAHANAGYVWVPTYKCDPNRFEPSGRCRGTIFGFDPLNNMQDAKDQGLTNEWNGNIGADIPVVPYRATVSFDLIGRQLIHAGQFVRGDPRAVFRDRGTSIETDPLVNVSFETRHGNVNLLLVAFGAKVVLVRNWVLTSSVLVPANRQGLQPSPTVVFGLERAFTTALIK